MLKIQKRVAWIFQTEMLRGLVWKCRTDMQTLTKLHEKMEMCGAINPLKRFASNFSRCKHNFGKILLLLKINIRTRYFHAIKNDLHCGILFYDWISK